MTNHTIYKNPKAKGVKFDVIYADLLKKLFIKLSLGEYKKVKIIIDTRKHKSGQMGEKKFREDVERFLKKEFSGTVSIFKMTPSYMDILVELADFVSNTFYKEYYTGSKNMFKDMGSRLIQIKNPL